MIEIIIYSLVIISIMILMIIMVIQTSFKFVIFIFIIVLLFLVPINEFKDCYDMYVIECNDCHSKNMSYLLCSGFCIESNNISERCETDLDKSCEDNIPKNYCVLESFRIRYGILKLWGEKIYSHSVY